MNDPKQNISELPLVRKGDACTADLFNKHAQAINSLVGGVRPPAQIFKTSGGGSDGAQGPQGHSGVQGFQGSGSGGSSADLYWVLGINQKIIGVQKTGGIQQACERPPLMQCWTSRNGITRSGYNATGVQCQCSDGSTTYNLLITPSYVVSVDQIVCVSLGAQGPQGATLIDANVDGRSFCQVS